MRLYGTLVMVCSGMLAPDPSGCDVRGRGDVWRMCRGVVWRSRESQAAEFTTASSLLIFSDMHHRWDDGMTPSHVFRWPSKGARLKLEL